ncbi:hypothetical protein M689_11885 [Neisseria gonorrhoeae SK23020]|nr:hypothetical protein M704_06935 [Neisseria gonorrhoeae SK29471]KLS39959.1 hypothetical protein M689_11885 [Neisseria gonorrhoeae SK23020]
MPTFAKSIACPPAIPALPPAFANTDNIANWRAAGSSVGRLNTSKAWVCKASPVRRAVASPYLMWQVGLPRRRLSLSIAGISS